MSTSTPPDSPKFRQLQARAAAYARWSKEDPRPAMEHVRDGFRARFIRQVDPDMVLDPSERERRADAAMRAHMTSLALKSARARASRGGEKRGGLR